MQVTMPVDHIRYDILVQQALRGMVRDVLAEAAKTKSLPGEHHFFITFQTTAEGVRLSERLRTQYPEEMTVVLQHQFWDFKVGEDAFEVGLSFGGVPERLTVPFEAIKVFQDPSVQFTLQFETLTEAPGESGEAKSPAPKIPSPRKRPPQRQEPARTSVPSSPRPAADSAETPPDQPTPAGKGGGAEVVRLDRFRKK
jgi:uncharacterized protein